jgi:hypothetical protein
MIDSGSGNAQAAADTGLSEFWSAGVGLQDRAVAPKIDDGQVWM